MSATIQSPNDTETFNNNKIILKEVSYRWVGVGCGELPLSSLNFVGGKFVLLL
jgi:hypothetical protein